MSMLRAFDYVFPLLGGDIEIPIHLCYQNAIIETAIFSHEKDVPDSNILYTQLQIIDKGLDGTGNDLIKYVTNNPDDTENYIRFSPFVIHELLSNAPVEKNHVYSIKKVDTGGNVDLGITTLLINERR